MIEKEAKELLERISELTKEEASNIILNRLEMNSVYDYQF